MPDDRLGSRTDDLSVAVLRQRDLRIVGLRGGLSLRSMGPVASALSGFLLDGHPVLVDLAGLRVRWVPATHVFPTTLAAAGGWPIARMVLFHARPEVAAALHSVGIPRMVPLAHDLRSAVQRLQARPARVVRGHELPPAVGSPRRARALARIACAEWSVTDLAEDAAMVASELVANAVEHAHTSCRLRIDLDGGELHVGVRDQRPGRFPRPQPPGHAAPRGHGLQLVAASCSRWGVTPQAGGKTVWAVLALPAAATG